VSTPYRLRFTEDELPPKRRAKAASVPQQPTLHHAEDVRSHKTPRLIHTADEIGRAELHRSVSRENEDDNVAVEAARQGEELSERVLQTGGHAARKLRAHRSSPQSVEQLPSGSKAQQKRAIRHQYAKNAAKAAREGSETAVQTGNVVERTIEKLRKGISHVRQNPRHTIVLLAIFLALSMLMNMASSCALVFQGLSSAIGSTTYPSADGDMLVAETEYSAMEAQLQRNLDNYERDHDYDEYEFDLDEIGHDPYVLISTLTALHGGEWTIAEVQGTLQWLFRLQYELTETETSEEKPDLENPDVVADYVSVKVELKNNKLSHLQYEIMNEGQLSMYSMYMATLGNRPDLFPGSEYIGRYGEGSYIHYDIPPEALADEKFAAMVQEAEKYLGYPYVWGGSSPSTSFDCSGFVCWVLNHSGWSVGRTTAQGLCDYCTPVRATDAHPGDLVFFVGTYDTPEVSHVGIYVGNNMMIHCGDPITYSNLNSVYWQQHLYCYGRLP